MKKTLKLCSVLIIIFILIGCFGESYDFSPPTITLSSNSNIESAELVEANINWRGEGNKPIQKETKYFSISKTTTTNVLYCRRKSGFAF